MKTATIQVTVNSIGNYIIKVKCGTHIRNTILSTFAETQTYILGVKDGLSAADIKVEVIDNI